MSDLSHALKTAELEHQLALANQMISRLRWTILPHAYCPECGEAIGDQDFDFNRDEFIIHKSCLVDN